MMCAIFVISFWALLILFSICLEYPRYCSAKRCSPWSNIFLTESFTFNLLIESSILPNNCFFFSSDKPNFKALIPNSATSLPIPRRLCFNLMLLFFSPIFRSITSGMKYNVDIFPCKKSWYCGCLAISSKSCLSPGVNLVNWFVFIDSWYKASLLTNGSENITFGVSYVPTGALAFSLSINALANSVWCSSIGLLYVEPTNVLESTFCPFLAFSLSERTFWVKLDLDAIFSGSLVALKCWTCSICSRNAFSCCLTISSVIALCLASSFWKSLIVNAARPCWYWLMWFFIWATRWYCCTICWFEISWTLDWNFCALDDFFEWRAL